VPSVGLKSRYKALGAKIIRAAAEWCDLVNFHPCCIEGASFPGKGSEGCDDPTYRWVPNGSLGPGLSSVSWVLCP
jgi:hypothetical protein